MATATMSSILSPAVLMILSKLGSGQFLLSAIIWYYSTECYDYYREDDRLDAQYIFEGHSLGVVSVCINQTGTIAASNSLDSHIRLWNLDSGELIQSIDAGPVNAWTVAFSPESDFLATCTQAGKIILYSVSTGEKMGKELDSNGKFSLCLAIVSYLVVQLYQSNLIAHSFIEKRWKTTRWGCH